MDAKIATVSRLGEARVNSPIQSRDADPEHPSLFVRESDYVPLHITVHLDRQRAGNILFEKAGPREKLYFDPSKTRAAVVTCGGLCPGLNNVIRSLVQSLHYAYGIQGVIGIRYGYHGMNPAHGMAPMELDPEMVSDIHEIGGTIIGTSRGPEDPKVMLEFLKAQGVGILFPVGGDGTQRGALAIYEEARRQGYPLAVVGVPKTIDNDIQYVTRTFGYTTSVDAARGIIDVAHTEARAVLNGVGLVKVMGRDSGFIAAGASLASGEVNYCLIPEQEFEADGPKGLLAVLQRRLEVKRHAVIVVAEGAGQHLMSEDHSNVDASGNVRKADIGLYLKERIGAHFQRLGQPVNVRYIDPSYAIRGLAANTEDAVLCDMLARNAAHAAMAGCTGLIIGFLHNRMIHVPTGMATDGRKKVELGSEIWKAVLASTGQPALWK
jgi:6-phosphofructokinase 1